MNKEKTEEKLRDQPAGTYLVRYSDRYDREGSSVLDRSKALMYDVLFNCCENEGASLVCAKAIC